MYNHIGAINRRIDTHEDGCPLPVEVEMLRKLVKMTKEIGGTYTGAYIEAYEELSTFMCGKDHELNKKFVDCTLEYIRGKFGDGDENHKITQRIRQSVNRVKENLKRDEEETFTYAYQAERMFPTDPEVLAKEAELSPLTADEIFAMQEPPAALFPSSPVTSAREEAKEPEVSNVSADCESQTKLATAGCKLTAHGAQTGKSGASVFNPENTIKPATVKDSSEKTGQIKCPISAIKKYIENGAFEYSDNPRPPLIASADYSLTNKRAPKETWRFMPVDQNGVPVLNAAYYATLLPERRPSPYREGNIIWINHNNDITDDIAKHLKMGDIIRHYSSMGT